MPYLWNRHKSVATLFGSGLIWAHHFLFAAPPRLKALAKTRSTSSAPGAAVRAYAFKLAADKETVFAQNIDNFISCTMESRETKPQVVMRNMRQFMSGMKNYLVTHGEREFIKEVECERSKVGQYII